MRTYLIGLLIAVGAAVSLISHWGGLSASQDKSARGDASLAAAARNPASGTSVPTVREGRVRPAREPQTVRLEPRICQAYVGRYRLTGPEAVLRVSGDTVTLTSERGRLFVEGKPGKAEMVPESETTFRVPASNATVTFIKDNTGEVTQAIVNLIGVVELTATRIK
jgi:hypothetical protein